MISQSLILTPIGKPQEHPPLRGEATNGRVDKRYKYSTGINQASIRSATFQLKADQLYGVQPYLLR